LLYCGYLDRTSEELQAELLEILAQSPKTRNQIISALTQGTIKVPESRTRVIDNLTKLIADGLVSRKNTHSHTRGRPKVIFFRVNLIKICEAKSECDQIEVEKDLSPKLEN
jgi:predicted ArsR family transcriptional regulator